ncbi:uncharacterized protein LOC111245441 isoform X4 [Varroa destructor]|uniref:Uncharacterized protein n=1 Tax=Varroa destructor TaxID=109461 RepID=A0A7M7JBR0_VARDE|nr:uncharacterized protein LOC111245441 isoform X4 [Varroa destructor]XP_022649552.1 uncharacterized protein LOC111245441 isoform X4 [Varroa destructor]
MILLLRLCKLTDFYCGDAKKRKNSPKKVKTHKRKKSHDTTLAVVLVIVMVALAILIIFWRSSVLKDIQPLTQRLSDNLGQSTGIDSVESKTQK